MNLNDSLSEYDEIQNWSPKELGLGSEPTSGSATEKVSVLRRTRSETWTAPPKFVRKSSNQNPLQKIFQQKLPKGFKTKLWKSADTDEDVTTENIEREPLRMTDILQSKDHLKLFDKYLQKLYCQENLEFLLDVYDYVKNSQTTDQDGRVKLAKNIHQTYIGADAEKQVNLYSTESKKIIEYLDDPPLTLFNTAYDAVIFLLEEETFQKFLMSEEFNSSSTLMAQPTRHDKPSQWLFQNATGGKLEDYLKENSIEQDSSELSGKSVRIYQSWNSTDNLKKVELTSSEPTKKHKKKKSKEKRRLTTGSEEINTIKDKLNNQGTEKKPKRNSKKIQSHKVEQKTVDSNPERSARRSVGKTRSATVREKTIPLDIS